MVTQSEYWRALSRYLDVCDVYVLRRALPCAWNAPSVTRLERERELPAGTARATLAERALRTHRSLSLFVWARRDAMLPAPRALEAAVDSGDCALLAAALDGGHVPPLERTRFAYKRNVQLVLRAAAVNAHMLRAVAAHVFALRADDDADAYVCDERAHVLLHAAALRVARSTGAWTHCGLTWMARCHTARATAAHRAARCPSTLSSCACTRRRDTGKSRRWVCC